MRLQKWLAACGLCSRHEAERWIGAGRVMVDGALALPGTVLADPEHCAVSVDGQPVAYRIEQPLYYLLHKPVGTLSSRRSQGGLPTIYELPALRRLPSLVHPVGRLDYNSEGLLLLTNDGTLTQRLCHPRFKQAKFYRVELASELSAEALRRLNAPAGFLLDGDRISAKVRPLPAATGRRGSCWYEVRVHEGRKHLVRLLMAACGPRVLRLIRSAMGPIKLPPELAPGELRALSADELQALAVYQV